MKRLFTLFICAILFFGVVFNSPQAGIPSSAASVSFKYKTQSLSGSKRKTCIYVNGKKISLSSTPIFLYGGSYYGEVLSILKTSSLKVVASSNNTNLVLKYKDKTLIMTNGDTTAYLNNEPTEFDNPPMRIKYVSSGKTRWVVPLKSICTRLGIGYVSSSLKITLMGTANSNNDSIEVKDELKKLKKALEKSDPTLTQIVKEIEDVKVDKVTKNDKPVVRVVLDPGHGKQDSGAVNRTLGISEKNLNLAIVLAAKKHFDKDPNIDVTYTRTADTYPSLDSRCNIANNAKADLFISVHNNSASSSSASGTETWYNSSRNSKTKNGSINSRSLAWAMQKAAVKATGFTNRCPSIKSLKDSSSLRVLRCTNMPACLIEYGFLSNNKEAKKIKANTVKYGESLYNAIVLYLKSLDLY